MCCEKCWMWYGFVMGCSDLRRPKCKCCCLSCLFTCIVSYISCWFSCCTYGLAWLSVTCLFFLPQPPPPPFFRLSHYSKHLTSVQHRKSLCTNITWVDTGGSHSLGIVLYFLSWYCLLIDMLVIIYWHSAIYWHASIYWLAALAEMRKI